MPLRPSLLINALYAPLATVVFVAVVLPLCLLIILGPTLGLRRFIGRHGTRLAMACIGAPIRIKGLEHLPEGTSVCVSNHASYLDGLVLTAALPPRYTFVVQDGAAGWPLIGLTIRRMGVTFVNRSSARAGAVQARALLKRLQGGESLAIFPEGTFREKAGLLKFKNGAFMMAARAGVPVVPAVIRGTRRLWGGGRRLPRWSHCHVEILQPQTAAGAEPEQIHALRDNVRAAILARCGERDQTHAEAKT